MRRRKLRIRIGVAVLLVVAAIGAFALVSLSHAGAFRTIEAHGPPVARTVTGFVGGTEDAVFRNDGPQVYVSSGTFRDPSKRGAIYWVDTESGGAPVDVTPKMDFPFQPHGLDLWRGPEGNERLFVVNHRTGSGFTDVAAVADVVHSIEVFDVQPDGKLRYLRSILDPALVSPNDVAAVSAEQFYVTNDHGFAPGVRRSIEDFLGLKFGNVVHFDGEKFTEVLDGLGYPNGIAASHDGGELYLAETTGGTVRVLRRDGATGALEQTWQSDHFTGLDNIDVAPDGSLWIGAHPKLLDFLGHARDATKLSPSQVLRVTRGADGFRVDEVWLSDGTEMSGSSVAATNGRVIVVGAVFQSRLLVLEPKLAP